MSLAVVDTLARTLYGEARAEELEGLVAVAWVVKNRAAQPCWWGNSIESVCLKAWQFSCWNEDDPNLPKMQAATLEDSVYRRCFAAAVLVLQGDIPDPTEGSTHYVNPDIVMPSWTDHMLETVQVGRHQFFKRRA